MDAHDELDHGPKRSEDGVTADGTCSSRKSTIDHMQYYMRSYGAKTHDCVRSPSRIVREKERERETAGGLLGVEGAERMGWGPILARKKRDFRCFCVSKNLISGICRPNSFLHASSACYIAKANTSMMEKHILLIALDSV